jgi:hypothetical protein
MKRAAEWPVDGERELLSRLKLEAVAELGEGHETAHLVVAVGAATKNLKREVELGPCSVAERGHRESSANPREQDYSAIF